MKRFLLLLIMCVGTLAQAQTLLIKNVNVIPMDSEQVLPGQQVLVIDNKVAGIGEALIIDGSETAKVIDGQGGYLMPGLAEMHAHIPSETAGKTAVDEVLRLYLANGIVLARGMLGEPSHLRLRQQLADGRQVGPELITSGPSLSGGSVSSRSQAVKMVRDQQAAGYDFIKLHPGLSRDQYQAAVNEGQRLNIPLAGHVSVAVGTELTLSSEQATIDHLDGYARALLPQDSQALRSDPGFFGAAIATDMDFSQLERLARQTAKARVWNVPTETLMLSTLGDTPLETMLNWPEMRYMDPATVKRWGSSVSGLREQYTQQQRRKLLAMRQQLLLALHRQGAGLLLGSDAPQIMNVPGFSIHRELQAMVDAGLTPYQALQMGTVNVGQFFQREHWGTIRAGSPASLVLLGANPLDDIANTRTVQAVMHQGQWHDRTALDGWLTTIADRH